jgi:hypothetical protein
VQTPCRVCDRDSFLYINLAWHRLCSQKCSRSLDAVRTLGTNLMTLRNSRVLFLLVFLFWTAGIARADAIFNFNCDPVGSDFYGPSTTFSNTSNGLTATFSGLAFPGGLPVALVPFFAPPFSGNILYDPGRQPVSNIDLDIAFSFQPNQHFDGLRDRRYRPICSCCV